MRCAPVIAGDFHASSGADRSGKKTDLRTLRSQPNSERSLVHSEAPKSSEMTARTVAPAIYPAIASTGTSETSTKFFGVLLAFFCVVCARLLGFGPEGYHDRSREGRGAAKSASNFDRLLSFLRARRSCVGAFFWWMKSDASPHGHLICSATMTSRRAL